MNRTFSIILIIAFTLMGCSSNTSVTNIPITVPPASPTNAETVTPSYAATATQTSLPTMTNTPAITSTFDPASIVTHTPSVAETCPPLANIAAPKFSKPDYSVITFKDNEQTVLDFLNQGGKPETLIKAVKNSGWLKRGDINGQIKDITGDNVPEIILSPSEIYVLGCIDSKYKILLKVANEGIAINYEQNRIVAIEDMNLDGIPELVIASYLCGGTNAGMCLDGWIYEWDGKQFATKLQVSLEGRQKSGAQPVMEVRNANDDQLLELTVTGEILGGGDYYYSFPWRQETDTYVWNGNEFIQHGSKFSSPQFRYQVVQDADRAILNEDYENAIKMYQNSIFGNYDWFSAERKQYIIDNASGISNSAEPDVDSNEQPNLAGYSYFRIMLTYLLQGNLDDAQKAYERIHKNFAKDSIGYDYVLIADAFWNEYQLSQDMEKACGKAIEYVKEHSDILKYLGSDYHNTFQDIMYKPEDICPFKK
ncbi:MAG: tetratricopeptide repeat protein [Chloroflexota bacterium]